MPIHSNLPAVIGIIMSDKGSLKIAALKETSANIISMSGYRISSRVLEKENLIRKQQELKEEAELLEVKNNIETFYGACNESIPLEGCDFELPTCWTVKPIQKRKYDRIDESSSDEEDSQQDIPHYRVLKQNLYRAPLQRIVAPIEETPCCDCNPRIGCGVRCQNRLLYMECAPGQCPSLASSKYCQPTKATNLSYRSRQSQRETKPETDMNNEPEVPISTEKGLSPEQEEYCLNTAIQTRTFPAVEVFLPTMDQSVEVEVADRAAVGATGGGSDGCNNTGSSSRKRSRAAPASPPVSKGHGLRILEPVRRGTIIVEYLGEVITAAEGLRRMGQYTASDAFYFAGLDNGLLLDAKAMGSVARFANHSCDPSCVLQKWTVHGECRLVLAAGRDLRAGDEITYNYHYFDDSLEGMRGMRRQVCLCGARNCCGTIGGRVLSTSAIGNEESGVHSWSLRDIHERCVTLQLLLPYNENEDEEKVERGSVTVVQTNTDVVVEVKPDPDFCMTTENTSSSIDHNDIETKPGVTAWNSSSTINDLPQRRHSPDTLQTLLIDIEAALTTAALEGPQQKTRFFSPATHLIPSLTNVAHRIRETLRLSELWLQRYTALFRGDAVSVSLSQAQELLSQAPGMVRLSEVTQLDALIKTALKAERMIDTLFNKVSTVTNTSTGNATEKNTTTRSLQWSEVVTTAKALQTALPILCSVLGAKKLLQAYEQSAGWARHLLGPVLSVGKQHNREKTTISSTIPICTNKGSAGNEDYAIFQRLLDAYFLSSPSELSGTINKTQSGKREELPFTLFYPLLNDGFRVAEWLEDRLTTYIEREQQVTVLHKRQTLSLSADIHIISSGTSSNSDLSSASHSSTNLVVDSKLSESASLFSPAQPCIRSVTATLNALITQHTTDSDSATIVSCCGSGGPETLYCFCRLPEDDGESTVLSQCALCYNWYHPHCVNAITTTLTAASRQKEFTCPICMHLQNTPSRFANAPESEWAHIRATKSTPGTASTTGSNKTASVSKYNTVKTSATMTNKSKKAVASQQTEGQDNLTGLSIPVCSNLSNTKRHPSRSAVSICTPGNRTTTSTTTTMIGYAWMVKLRPVPAMKARDFLTLAEVDAALLKEATLLSTGSPTALLVRLARGYLTTWQQHCTTFLTSCAMCETLQLLNNHISSAITGHVGKSMITTEALAQQTRVLQRALELYFHPRLIRIRDEELCLQLRQLAWIITTSTLLRCVVLDNDIIPQIPSESSHNTILFPRSLLSLSELTSIIAGGASLFTTPGTNSTTTSSSSSTSLLSIAKLGASLLQWLRKFQDKTRALLAQAVQCRSCVEATVLVSQLQTVASQGVVYVHTEFGFAVVSCLSRPRAAVAAALPDGSIVACSTAALNTLPGELSDMKHSNTMSVSGPVTASVPTATTDTGTTTERSDACLSKSSSDDMLIVPAVTSESETDGAYCWCRGADDGSAMVSCDCCDEWFHCTCVGLRSLRALTTTSSISTSSSIKSSKNKSKQQKNIQATYICISCTILTGTEYVYKW